MKEATNLPLLFERVGFFLDQLAKLEEHWPSLSPDARLAEIEKVFAHRSPSALDVAIEAHETILDTIYYDRAARACLTGSPKMAGRI